MHQRRWLRFPGDASTVRVAPTRASDRFAEVIDESFEGAALQLEHVDGLSLDEEVKLVLRGSPISGIVRYIVPTPDGRYRIGVQWHEDAKVVAAKG